METPELIIWSVMLGGILTLATVALTDVLINRSVSSFRALIFILLTGGSCLIISGLVDVLLPGIPVGAINIMKASLGPLSGALALTYLGMWLGVAAEDPIVHYTIAGGSVALVCASILLIVFAIYVGTTDSRPLILMSAAISILSMSLATVASIRAAYLGDPLARFMALAQFFLAIALIGLYGHSLQPGRMGWGALLLTSFSTVAYFLIIMALSVSRSRLQNRLERLAGLSQGADPATGLPKGSVLLSKVDDAFWRSARLNRECTVICLHLRNLYELAELAGHNTDQQILSAMAARMRRAVGFRNVVGLYHPRCFVVVLCTHNQPKLLDHTLQRLRYLMGKPLSVIGLDGGHHAFTARFGMGSITVKASSADPTTVIDQAERMALTSNGEPGHIDLRNDAASPF